MSKTEQLRGEFFNRWQRGDSPENLANYLRDYISQNFREYDDYLDIIAGLKHDFQSDLPHRAVVEAIPEATIDDCRRIRWHGEDYGVIDMRKSSANRKSIPPSRREKVHERDNWQCVRCGYDADFEIHHIVPVSHGGLNHEKNLATLCEECNLEAHAGDYSTRRMVYDGIREFWEEFVEEYHE